jgi:hypothetical protein
MQMKMWYAIAVLAVPLISGCQRAPREHHVKVDPITIEPIHVQHDVSVRIEKESAASPSTAPAR